MNIEFTTTTVLLSAVIIALAVMIWRGIVYLRRIVRESEKMRLKIQEIQGRTKEEALKLEREFVERNAQVAVREGILQNRADQIAAQENELANAKKVLQARERELQELGAEYARKLENVAGTTFEEARAEIIKVAEANARDEARKIRHDLLEMSESEYKKDAHRILLTVMQRIAPKMNTEQSSNIVEIPAEDVKGRLIGREGRNIRCFEQVTGATLIIDDTPGSVLVSCFDPFRRHVATQALRRLIEDGRIHPQSIEYFFEESRNEAMQNTLEIGTKACDSIGVYNVPESIRELLGRLQYRLSYNQNTLDHSIETARVAGTLASEMGSMSSWQNARDFFTILAKRLMKKMKKLTPSRERVLCVQQASPTQLSMPSKVITAMCRIQLCWGRSSWWQIRFRQRVLARAHFRVRAILNV